MREIIYEAEYVKGVLVDIENMVRNDKSLDRGRLVARSPRIVSVKFIITVDDDDEVIPGDIFTHKRSGVDYTYNPGGMIPSQTGS